MTEVNVIDLVEKRATKERAELADTVAEQLGVTTAGLADILDVSIDAIREGFLEAVERHAMYRAHDEQRKARERQKGLDPNTCCNMVCNQYVQSEFVTVDPDTGACAYSGRHDYCRAEKAQGCIFRLLERPYSDPFVDIPSHNECVRILQRIGYVRNGSFEEEYGTNFMFHSATHALWRAYVLLLVETGRIKIPQADLAALQHLEEQHAKFCGGQDLAHRYFRDRELLPDVATTAELVAQRNALLGFIRGEIAWPDGCCPCGGDVHDGTAHADNCIVAARHHNPI